MWNIIFLLFISTLKCIAAQVGLPSACQAVLPNGLGHGICFPAAICKEFEGLPQGNCADNSCCFITGLEPFKCGNKGRKPTKIKPRILGGKLTGSNEFCWQVAITDGDGNFIGGGSLIKPGVVLTAAHLVAETSPEKVLVHLGTPDLSSPDACSQTLNVSEIIIHEQYNSSANYINNIALLKLGGLADISSDCVCLACLPDGNEHFDGRLCEASGYGSTIGAGKETSNMLRSVTLLVKDKNLCQEKLRNYLPDFEVHSSFLCAGGDDDRQDTCTGDGGSPLVCPNVGGKYVQAGIVSWGLGCSEIGLSSIYTNVAALLPWILSKIQSSNQSTTDPVGILPIFPGVPNSFLQTTEAPKKTSENYHSLTTKSQVPVITTMNPKRTQFPVISPKRPIIFNPNSLREGLEGRSSDYFNEY